jgi:hypothetical protein
LAPGSVLGKAKKLEKGLKSVMELVWEQARDSELV